MDVEADWLVDQQKKSQALTFHPRTLSFAG
jgi:hypothetical protein